MAWRVATRPSKTSLEVIDPKDWDSFSNEQQQSFQSVSEFHTEQEADKFAIGQLVQALPVRAKPPSRRRFVAVPPTPVVAVEM